MVSHMGFCFHVRILTIAKNLDTLSTTFAGFSNLGMEGVLRGCFFGNDIL